MDETTRQTIEHRVADLERSLAGWQQTALQARQEISWHEGAVTELRRLLEAPPAAPEQNASG